MVLNSSLPPPTHLPGDTVFDGLTQVAGAEAKLRTVCGEAKD